jgi:hypothetical protein
MIYVDMDGVLAKWNNDATQEDTFKKGYFLNCEADEKMIDLVLNLSKIYEVVILSHAYQNGYAEDEKRQWLENHDLGSIRQYFVPYGIPKSEYLMKYEYNYDQFTNVLIDDFTDNLTEWENCCSNNHAIKYYNGVNGTHGKWSGDSIYHTESSAELFKQVLSMIDKFQKANKHHKHTLFISNIEWEVSPKVLNDKIHDMFLNFGYKQWESILEYSYYDLDDSSLDLSEEFLSKVINEQLDHGLIDIADIFLFERRMKIESEENLTLDEIKKYLMQKNRGFKVKNFTVEVID